MVEPEEWDLVTVSTKMRRKQRALDRCIERPETGRTAGKGGGSPRLRLVRAGQPHDHGGEQPQVATVATEEHDLG